VPRLSTLPTIALLCSAALGCADTRPVSSDSDRTPVTVRSSLDKTAAWVGDLVTFTVEIVCAQGYDIVEGDLSRDHLPLEGLEIRAATTARETRDGGAVLYRARFQLASFTPEQERLRVGPMSIRYYRKQPDGRINDQAPAGVAGVPAQDIALRSTLPASVALVLRSAKPLVLLPSISHLLVPFGLVLVAVSLMTAALGYTGIIRRQTSARTPDSALSPATDYRSALDTIRGVGHTGNVEALRHAFGRLEHLLRTFLAETDPHAASLTPDEIDARADARGDSTMRRTIARVLRDCERARFGGPAHPPSGELLVQALDQAQTVFISTPVQSQ
jgi:hypothetical protein